MVANKLKISLNKENKAIILYNIDVLYLISLNDIIVILCGCKNNF